jgi:hypothetical protein
MDSLICSFATYLNALAVVRWNPTAERSCSWTHNAENDCIMAETWVRMDHLESRHVDVKHEDLLNGVLGGAPDHMHESTQRVESAADGAASHRHRPSSRTWYVVDEDCTSSRLSTLIITTDLVCFVKTVEAFTGHCAESVDFVGLL